MKQKKYLPYLFSLLSITGVAVVGYILLPWIGYQAVALMLLVAVSLLAMLLDIWPVVMAAISSALIWNYFFIPPRFTFHIDRPEDILMFLMYFIIALVHAVLTFRIKVQERKARDREEKEKTIQLYNTLLHSLSHELKTPIATIIASADTLLDDGNRIPRLVETDLVREIEKAAMRLHQHVENLLSMSRIESGMLRVKRDWCDIRDLIAAVRQKLEHTDQARLTLRFPDQLPLFYLDSGLIEQVIYNLLQNAFQYTSPTSPVELSVAYDGEQCSIAIRDHGPGIPKGEEEHIFKKFYRLPGTKAGGTGLGLSIAKGIVEAHQGSLTVENGAHDGAIFTLRLPGQVSFINYLKHE